MEGVLFLWHSTLLKIRGSWIDPVADYAIIPTWFLAQKAAQDVTVILSGEGGDELFCGYGRYRSASRPWWKGKRRMWRRGIFDNMNILRHHPAHWRDGIAAAEMAAADASTPLSRLQAVDIAEWLPNDRSQKSWPSFFSCHAMACLANRARKSSGL